VWSKEKGKAQVGSTSQLMAEAMPVPVLVPIWRVELSSLEGFKTWVSFLY